MHSIAYHMFFHSLSDGFVSLAPQCDSSIGPGRRRIGINRSIFSAVTLLEILCRACIAQVWWNWCPAVCAKLNMMYKWIVELMLTRLKSFGWFYWLVIDFTMAEINQCCWLWTPCSDHVNMENAFAAHLIHQYIVYICMHCGTVGHFQSEFSFATDSVF